LSLTIQFYPLSLHDALPISLAELIRLVRPKPTAKVVVFHSFGEGVALHEGVVGVRYYDNLSIENALNPQTLLAYEMNDQPLNHRSEEHTSELHHQIISYAVF